jgi:hypothetical protein
MLQAVDRLGRQSRAVARDTEVTEIKMNRCIWIIWFAKLTLHLKAGITLTLQVTALFAAEAAPTYRTRFSLFVFHFSLA